MWVRIAGSSLLLAAIPVPFINCVESSSKDRRAVEVVDGGRSRLGNLSMEKSVCGPANDAKAQHTAPSLRRVALAVAGRYANDSGYLTK